MNDLLKIFDPNHYPDIPPKRGFTYAYQPPGMVRVRGNVQGDTFMLDSSKDYWEVSYGGKKFNIDWNHVDFVGVDHSFIALWRHHLIEEIQVKSPPTVHRKFINFLSVAHDISPDLSLASLLAIFSRLHTEGRLACFYELRVFYNWGIMHGIDVFDRRTQGIINDLLTSKNNPYASIFLQQNYVTPEQEVRLLQHIDMRISCVESIPDHKFNSSLYRELRDATLLLLVFEIAPRPLQIFMLELGDLKEINSDDDCYYSIRLRRNKNRHLSDEYTSPREISGRLGKALKKIVLLNQYLFEKTDNKSDPLFLGNQGNRWASNAISRTVSWAIESVFGIEKLDVEGAITPFRHHLGQSLADQGAPSSVIADRLGHSTEVAARAYITATPNIAKIKTRALGENETYQYLMNALMTGSIMRNDEVDDEASIVRGTVGMHYIEGIGACDVKGHCHSNPVYACYTCRKFHPFVDGPHDLVVEALQEQVVTFMHSTADLQHSRPVTQLEIVIESAKAVSKECKSYEG
jgi:integrase